MEAGQGHDHGAVAYFDGNLRRKDCSRWVTNLFGDYRLGAIVSELEEHYRMGNAPEVAASLVREIRSLYNLAYDGFQPSGTSDQPKAEAARTVSRWQRRFPQAES